MPEEISYNEALTKLFEQARQELASHFCSVAKPESEALGCFEAFCQQHKVIHYIEGTDRWVRKYAVATISKARKLISILSSNLTGHASYLATSSMLEDEMHSCHNSFSAATEIYKALGLEERIPSKYLV
jgi:hypothetical protein